MLALVAVEDEDEEGGVPTVASDGSASDDPPLELAGLVERWPGETTEEGREVGGAVVVAIDDVPPPDVPGLLGQQAISIGGWGCVTDTVIAVWCGTLVFRGVEGGAGVGTGDLELLPSRGGHRDDGEEDDDARSTLSVFSGAEGLGSGPDLLRRRARALLRPSVLLSLAPRSKI